MLNEKGVITWLANVERWVLTGSLCTVLDMHTLFNKNKLEWIARSLGLYSEEVVREF